jgi:hypoxanthine phosphoribosyltransferase
LITCENVIEKLKDLQIDYKPDVLIGFIRGGVVITGLMQYKLGIRNIDFIDVTLYNVKKSPRDYVLKDMFKVYNILKKYNNKKILFIDDVIDTGKTLQLVKDTIDNFDLNINYKIFTIVYKENKLIEPDYYLFKTKSWVDFEWEMIND